MTRKNDSQQKIDAEVLSVAKEIVSKILMNTNGLGKKKLETGLEGYWKKSELANKGQTNAEARENQEKGNGEL